MNNVRDATDNDLRNTAAGPAGVGEGVRRSEGRMGGWERRMNKEMTKRMQKGREVEEQ